MPDLSSQIVCYFRYLQHAPCPRILQSDESNQPVSSIHNADCSCQDETASLSHWIRASARASFMESGRWGSPCSRTTVPSVNFISRNVTANPDRRTPSEIVDSTFGFTSSELSSVMLCFSSISGLIILSASRAAPDTGLFVVSDVRLFVDYLSTNSGHKHCIAP